MKIKFFKTIFILFSSFIVFFLVQNYAFSAGVNSKKGSKGFYIPTKTRIKAVLLNGGDIKTNHNIPVLIKLISRGTYPKGYKGKNLKSCFVIARAYYNSLLCKSCLYIKTLRLSCIVKHGAYHEAGHIYGYATDKSKSRTLKSMLKSKNLISLNPGRKVTIVITKKSYISIGPNIIKK
jgi:hypothetical protein